MSKPAQAIILMGTTGSGKSTVGTLLAENLGWPFYDADSFHPPANKEKMSSGLPLTDSDRLPWLTRLHELIAGELAHNISLVLACSALKASYRTILRGDETNVTFVHLDGSRECLASRLAGRTDHFMNPELLDSQLETLEPDPDAVRVSIEPSPQDIVVRIIGHLPALRKQS